MEKIRRSIKLFFAIYGNFLFKIAAGIVIIILVLRGINYLYVQNSNVINKQNEIRDEEDKEEEIKNNKEEVKDNKYLLKEFITYCNQKDIENAYIMISNKMKKEGYSIELFNTEIIQKIFTYEKEYEIKEIDNDYFEVLIKEGIIETGSIENRKSDELKCKVINEGTEKKIYIER